MAPTPQPAVAFAAYLARRSPELVAEFATTRTGDAPGASSGQYVAIGSDFAVMETGEDGGSAWTREQRFVDGVGFHRVDDEQWWVTQNIHLDGSLLSVLRDAAWTPHSAGSNWLTGEGIDMQALASAIGVLPANLRPGIVVGDVYGANADFEVAGDIRVRIGSGGMPVEFEVELEVTRTGDAEGTDRYSVELDVDLEASPGPIEAPTDALRREFSPELGYMLSLPYGFEPGEHEGDIDLFVNADGSMVEMGRYTSGGYPAEQNYDEFIARALTPDAGFGPLELNESVELSGVPARFMAAHATQDGYDLYFMIAHIQTGRFWYIIHWYGPASEGEDEQLATFREILSSVMLFGG